MEKYKTKGTCSRYINYQIENDILTFVEFIGGCEGNSKGLAKLALGRPIDEIIALLQGINCRGGTSCPDQLAQALTEYKLSH